MEFELPALTFLLYEPKDSQNFRQAQLLSAHWFSTDPGYAGELCFEPAEETGTVWGHYIAWERADEAEAALEKQLTSERHALFHDGVEEWKWKGVLLSKGLDERRLAELVNSPLVEVAVYRLKEAEDFALGMRAYLALAEELRGVRMVAFLPEAGPEPEIAVGVIAWAHRRARRTMVERRDLMGVWQEWMEAAEPVVEPVLVRSHL